MLLTLIVAATIAPKTLFLAPKESVWVYANASTPGDGTYLRAWGVDGKSCPADGEDGGQYSFSYLKWDLAEVPKGAKLLAAKLIVKNIPDPGYSLESAKKYPLEVRPLVGDFDSKKWTYDMAAKVHPAPGAKAIFGTGFPGEILKETPVTISIDLLSGPNSFTKLLQSALESPGHALNLCITAALDPSTDGRTAVYKVYGQNEANLSLRPQLVLKFDE